MRTRKNTLVLFSKVPEPGLVKTRLTVLKDGIFDTEDAAALYQCMLFDVVEIIGAAMRDLEAESRAAAGLSGMGDTNPQVNDVDLLEAHNGVDLRHRDNARSSEAVAAGEDVVLDEYELLLSTVPAENVEVMRALFEEHGPWPHAIEFTYDEGASFDDHYNCAFQKAWDRGADCVLSMGADMPALTKRDVRAGFEALHRLDGVAGGGIVISPDQEMGVSVVGWTRDTDFDHSGVYYCRNGLTVLPAYIQKAQQLGLPALWLPPVPDVDTIQDLQHNITLVEALCYCSHYDDVAAPRRTHAWLVDQGLGQVRVMPNDLHDPRAHIDGAEPEA